MRAGVADGLIAGLMSVNEAGHDHELERRREHGREHGREHERGEKRDLERDR